jgi:hypothetical protein
MISGNNAITQNRIAHLIAPTLVGWISLIKGLIFMFLSLDAAVNYFAALHYERFFYVYAGIDLILSAYLVYAGFRSTSQM